jgi:hypothetical protein
MDIRGQSMGLVQVFWRWSLASQLGLPSHAIKVDRLRCILRCAQEPPAMTEEEEEEEEEPKQARNQCETDHTTNNASSDGNCVGAFGTRAAS